MSVVNSGLYVVGLASVNYFSGSVLRTPNGGEGLANVRDLGILAASVEFRGDAML